MAHSKMISSLAMLFMATMTAASEPAKDKDGRTWIRGPVFGGSYDNVHIVSDTVGISYSNGLTLTNSVIEAHVCVEVGPSRNYINNNLLKCGGCIKFPMGGLTNNVLSNNRCAGDLTNRPDVFR